MPYFAERRLSEIRKADLQAFALCLKEEEGQNGKTVNNCLAAGTVALRWAAENKYIPINPAEGLMKFSGKSVKRGVLAGDAVCKLFAKPWLHGRACVGNLLAMSTGLRLGEVLAVQALDIEKDRLRVRHFWSEQVKLKMTSRRSCKSTFELAVGKEHSVRDLISQDQRGTATSAEFLLIDADALKVWLTPGCQRHTYVLGRWSSP